MKNLIIIAIMLIGMNASAQSLAEKTGETKSFYDAVCILNGITPGTIGMTEGRALMQDYALSIGLSYELYQFNSKNNLYILHYVATVSTAETVSATASTTNLTIAQENIVSEKSEVVNESKTIELIKLNSIAVDSVSNTFIIVESVVNQVELITQGGITCDCANKTVAELNQYYTDLLALRRKARGLQKDKLNACAYQLRKYKKIVEREEREEGKEPDYTFNELLPNYKMGTNSFITVSQKVDEPIVKKRKVRRSIGNGFTQGKNTSFWVKLFPFINC